MGMEIERRFHVANDNWRALAQGTWYKQGYLSVDPDRTVRVRIVGDQAWLTLKGRVSNVSRQEFEYVIPLADANAMLGSMCPMLVEKKRYRIEREGLVWEVDEFFGANTGLILAEVELASEDQPYTAPDWLGHEVTEDPRYTNAYLSQHPYPTWSQQDDQ
ncbi:CYTH domain-containing protein [Parachitinimonas caeni]|uniref:CYTH domain-containing protein n=1 Tax=Parachitinimonas caeni TaxID=3031301 RepID=A0ABT7DRK9_9NEIS|nr:CYTH domain-containing protein [Parachitinimonas caeni]MDK2122703.1 CYTH domain-containing protein [Parachitinimonas caeni]